MCCNGCGDDKKTNKLYFDCNKLVLQSLQTNIDTPFLYESDYDIYNTQTMNITDSIDISLLDGFLMIQTTNTIFLTFDTLYANNSFDKSIDAYTSNDVITNNASVTLLIPEIFNTNDKIMLGSTEIIANIHFNIGNDLVETIANLNTYINTLPSFTSMIDINSLIINVLESTYASNNINVSYNGIANIQFDTQTFETDSPKHIKTDIVNKIYMKDGLLLGSVNIKNISDDEFVTVKVVNTKNI